MWTAPKRPEPTCRICFRKVRNDSESLAEHVAWHRFGPEDAHRCFPDEVVALAEPRANDATAAERSAAGQEVLANLGPPPRRVELISIMRAPFAWIERLGPVALFACIALSWTYSVLIPPFASVAGSAVAEARVVSKRVANGLPEDFILSVKREGSSRVLQVRVPLPAYYAAKPGDAVTLRYFPAFPIVPGLNGEPSIGIPDVLLGLSLWLAVFGLLHFRIMRPRRLLIHGLPVVGTMGVRFSRTRALVKFEFDGRERTSSTQFDVYCRAKNLVVFVDPSSPQTSFVYDPKFSIWTVAPAICLDTGS